MARRPTHSNHITGANRVSREARILPLWSTRAARPSLSRRGILSCCEIWDKKKTPLRRSVCFGWIRSVLKNRVIGEECVLICEIVLSQKRRAIFIQLGQLASRAKGRLVSADWLIANKNAIDITVGFFGVS